MLEAKALWEHTCIAGGLFWWQTQERDKPVLEFVPFFVIFTETHRGRSLSLNFLASIVRIAPDSSSLVHCLIDLLITSANSVQDTF